MTYPTKKLWEICKVIKGKNPELFFDTWEWKIPYLTAKYIRWLQNPSFALKSDKKSTLVNKTDIVIICDWSNSGETFIGLEWVLSSTMWKLSFYHEVNTLFINHFLVLIIKELKTRRFWAAIPHLDIKWLLSYKIPLPPLPTQKLIVQKLDSSFEKIDKSIKITKKNLENLEQLNKSVLEEVFREWEYEEVELIKISNFYSKWILPNDYEIYNYIWLENIESNTWKLVNFTQTEWKKIKSNKVLFKKWMILYWKLRPYLNKVLVSEFDWVATTEILPIKCWKNLYNFYLWYFLRTEYFVNLANTNISWARMPRVTTKFLKEKIKIPLPPLPKQKEIVTYLDKVFEKNKSLKSEYERKLKDLEELKQSLLKEAFEWRLVKE